jgi:hypothetical protein
MKMKSKVQSPKSKVSGSRCLSLVTRHSTPGKKMETGRMPVLL